MKIVVAPDKFKGSLMAGQVAAAIAAGLRAELPAADLVTVARAAARHGIPVVTVAGRSTLTEPQLITAVTGP